MNKEKILKIFYSLLEEWEDAESVVIHDRGDVSEFEELREKKIQYECDIKQALCLND